MKKVLIISPYYDDVNHWMVSTIKYAENLSKISEVVVFTGGNKTEIVKKNNLKIYKFKDIFIKDPANYGIIPFQYYKLNKVLKHENPDHVIINKHMFHTALCSIFLRLKKIPFTISTDTFPGYVWWSENKLVNVILYLYSRTVGNLALKLSNKVILFHEGLVSTAKKLNLNYRVIHNGIDLKKLEHIKLKNTNKVIVGYVGRLESVKRYKDIIEVASRFSKDVEFHFVGENKKYKSAGNLKFIGYKKNIYDYMSKFDIFVISSKSEGLPNALMEAMSIGVAPVVTNVGGNVTLVKNKKNGLTYPVGDIDKLESAIKYLINNPNKRKQYGKRSKKIIFDNYDWDKISKKIIKYLA